LPQPKASQRSSFTERLTLGLRIFLSTPRLRGLLALTLAAAAAGAIVFVNTVVIVRDALGSGDRTVALTLAAFGLGSMGSALALPRILARDPDRLVMLAGASIMTAGLVAAAVVLWSFTGAAVWFALLPLWSILGIGYGMMLTPTGRLLRRSAHDADRPGLFAAQFALSHACWLFTYLVAGWVGAIVGLPATILLHAATAGFALIIATRLWPQDDPYTIAHTHADLPASHPHLREHAGQHSHAHAFVIDALHRRWPG
jgi:MFS family permease